MACATSVPTAGKEIGLCKICLEEDNITDLEEPCGCMGTQKYAHHACIQRWIEEKGNLKCEICENQYKGEYNLPEPSPSGEAVAMYGPMFIQVEGERVNPMDRVNLWDEQQRQDNNKTSLSYILSFVVFGIFLIILHHTMYVTETQDGESSQSYAASLVVFLFWVMAKALLIGIPLYAVMKLAARQAQREQYQAIYQTHTPNRPVVFRAGVIRQDAQEDPQSTDPLVGPERV